MTGALLASRSPVPAHLEPPSPESLARWAADPLRVGFVMSTEVGLRTQYLNWRTCLPPEAGIVPTWAVIEWWHDTGRLERLPGVPHLIKARLRSRLELRAGLGDRPLDALFVAAMAVFYGTERRLTRQPYFVTTDTTPLQQVPFRALYGRRPIRLPFLEPLKHAVYRRQYAGARAIFPWSTWAAASFAEDYGVDPARLHVVPPGVDLAKWTFPPRVADDGPVNILFVGGDFYRKGGDLLLDWAERTRLGNWRLHLVTRDPVRRSHANVRVHHGLTPNDPRLLELYRAAHVFALPTRADCYSIATIEAMAAGLPAVLSTIGGTGDILRDGETGFQIPPGDADALAARLDDLVSEPAARVRMGLAARADAEARYDARKNILRTVGVMRAALGHPGS